MEGKEISAYTVVSPSPEHGSTSEEKAKRKTSTQSHRHQEHISVEQSLTVDVLLIVVDEVRLAKDHIHW